MTDLLRQLGSLSAAQVVAAVAVAVGIYLVVAKGRGALLRWVHRRVDAGWAGAVSPLESAISGLAARLKVLEERIDWLIGRVSGAEAAARGAHERLDGREDRKR